MIKSSSSDKKRSIFDCATALLAMREHFSKELSEKLLLKGYEKSETAQVIEKLSELNYLNDLRAAGFYAEEMKRKRKGFNYFRQKLYEKGGAELVSSLKLRDFYTLNEEIRNAKHELDKMKDDSVDKKIRKLVSHGFSYESAKALLNYDEYDL